MAETLGTFEQAVLLAVFRLKDDAYGRGILREVQERLKRDIAAGAIHMSPVLSICVAVIMIGACGSLLAVGGICGILGVGNLLNGGHYISTGPALFLAGVSVCALTGAFFSPEVFCV